MTWVPRAPRWPWRKYLTSEEAAILSRADRGLAELRKEMRKWSTQRTPIVNRAIQRAKYAAKAR